MVREFPDMNVQAMISQLNMRGKELGIEFTPWTLLSNSRQALEAGEFAKDHSLHDAMHEALFRAYLVDGLNIGQREVILNAARSVGLNAKALNMVLDKQVYRPRLMELSHLIRTKGITAAPTFEIDNGKRIVGVMPMETFRQALREALEEAGSR